MRSRLCASLPLAWLLLGPAAWAQGEPTPVVEGGPQEQVQIAEELIAEGDFEDAVRALQEVLKNGEAPKPTLLETYRLMGLAALYLGNERRARQAYDLLLELEPSYELAEDTPPKVRALVETTRKGRVDGGRKHPGPE